MDISRSEFNELHNAQIGSVVLVCGLPVQIRSAIDSSNHYVTVDPLCSICALSGSNCINERGLICGPHGGRKSVYFQRVDDVLGS